MGWTNSGYGVGTDWTCLYGRLRPPDRSSSGPDLLHCTDLKSTYPTTTSSSLRVATHYTLVPRPVRSGSLPRTGGVCVSPSQSMTQGELPSGVLSSPLSVIVPPQRATTPEGEGRVLSLDCPHGPQRRVTFVDPFWSDLYPRDSGPDSRSVQGLVLLRSGTGNVVSSNSLC